MSSRCCLDESATRESMKRLFNPRGVAIIGASTNPGKIGYRIVENMVKSGYTGRIYPINPKGGEILGWPVHATLAEVEGDVDVAVLSVPADHVMAAVADCGAKRVGHLVVVTSGFSEIGNIAGEKDVVALAHAHGMRVLGPNVFGIYSASSRLDATFGPGGILPGHVAIVTQSGALGIAMIGKTAAESLGLSALISVGNKSDIDEADLLTYLGDDPETRVVLLYIEGVKNGERLVRMLRQVTKRKHVVVIKSGRSARGAMAAASHTGSLAGADDVFDDVMRECGVLRAESVQEAFNWVRFLASAPLPSGEDAVIVTNGGGIGVLATDACEKYGVRLYDNQPVLATAFAEVMPEFGSSKNPVDLTGQATGQDYARSLDAVLARSDMHAAIALYCETALFDTTQFADLLRSVYRRYEGTKPIVLALFGGERDRHRRQLLVVGNHAKHLDAKLGDLREMDFPKILHVNDLVHDDSRDRSFIRADEPLDERDVIGDLVLRAADHDDDGAAGLLGDGQRIEADGRSVRKVLAALDEHSIPARADCSQRAPQLIEHRGTVVHETQLRVIEPDAHRLGFLLEVEQAREESGIVVPQSLLAVQKPVAQRLHVPEPPIEDTRQADQHARLSRTLTRRRHDQRLHAASPPWVWNKILTSTALTPSP